MDSSQLIDSSHTLNPCIRVKLTYRSPDSNEKFVCIIERKDILIVSILHMNPHWNQACRPYFPVLYVAKLDLVSLSVYRIINVFVTDV